MHKLEAIKMRYMFAIFVVFLTASIWLLRQNNLHMVHLRQEVIEVDAETGDINQVAPRLERLGNFVLTRMNTDMGAPLELPGTYNEAVEEIRQSVAASGSANSAVYAQAQQVCENPSVLLTVRAQCIQDYVTTNAAPGTAIQNLQFPDKALYSYSFSSPVWSTDYAGFSVLVALLSFMVLLVQFTARFVLPALQRWIDDDPLE